MSRSRLVLTELREYRSAKGSTYFAGFLGKARVVMLRDDRAEITGKEVARWNVLLEEPQPREALADRAGSVQGARGGPRAGAGGREGAPRHSQGRQGHAARMPDQRQRERTAAERRASQSLRERGIDPGTPMASDPLPF